MSGWFAVKRGITSHPIFKGKPERLAIWLWMLDNAAWKDTPHDINGKTVTVRRGQVCASERRIAAEVGVGRQVVRTFIDRLDAEAMINPDPNHGRTIITLCNYEKYQAAQPAPNPSPNPAATHDQPIKEQGNNLKKVETKVSTLRGDATPDGFDAFWQAYPHRHGAKKGRKPAAAKYAAALKAGATPADILEGAKRAHRDPAVANGYARDPATWLNQAGWQDDIPSNVTTLVRKEQPQPGDTKIRARDGQLMIYGNHYDGWLPCHG